MTNNRYSFSYRWHQLELSWCNLPNLLWLINNAPPDQWHDNPECSIMSTATWPSSLLITAALDLMVATRTSAVVVGPTASGEAWANRRCPTAISLPAVPGQVPSPTASVASGCSLQARTAALEMDRLVAVVAYWLSWALSSGTFLYCQSSNLLGEHENLLLQLIQLCDGLSFCFTAAACSSFLSVISSLTLSSTLCNWTTLCYQCNTTTNVTDSLTGTFNDPTTNNTTQFSYHMDQKYSHMTSHAHHL